VRAWGRNAWRATKGDIGSRCLLPEALALKLSSSPGVKIICQDKDASGLFAKMVENEMLWQRSHSRGLTTSEGVTRNAAKQPITDNMKARSNRCASCSVPRHRSRRTSEGGS